MDKLIFFLIKILIFPIYAIILLLICWNPKGSSDWTFGDYIHSVVDGLMQFWSA